MNDDNKTTSTLKFRPDMIWPKPGSEKNCPRDGTPMQLMENLPTYSGKPWWCPDCQWQFSEEELDIK
jgi:hypothetical protein